MLISNRCLCQFGTKHSRFSGKQAKIMDSNTGQNARWNRLFNTASTENAGESVWMPRYMIGTSRLISVGILIVAAVRFVLHFRFRALLILLMWSTIIETTSFILLLLCTLRRGCSNVLAITATFMHQSGASLAITSLIVGPLRAKAGDRAKLAIFASCTLAPFVVDSVVMGARLRFSLIGALVPIFIGTVHFIVASSVTGWSLYTEMPQSKFRDALIAVSWHIAGSILAVPLSRFSSCFEKRRQQENEERESSSRERICVSSMV